MYLSTCIFVIMHVINFKELFLDVTRQNIDVLTIVHNTCPRLS